MHTHAHTSQKRARARFVARIFMKNLLMIFYYLMNRSLKFHKDQSFCCGDICKTILTFVWSLIFYVICIFSKFEHQNSINLENYKLGIWSFGNLMSKCDRLSEHMKHLTAIEVIYKLRNKQKDYLISHETPCISFWAVCTCKPAQLFSNNNNNYWSTWSVLWLIYCQEQVMSHKTGIDWYFSQYTS